MFRPGHLQGLRPPCIQAPVATNLYTFPNATCLVRLQARRHNDGRWRCASPCPATPKTMQVGGTSKCSCQVDSPILPAPSSQRPVPTRRRRVLQCGCPLAQACTVDRHDNNCLLSVSPWRHSAKSNRNSPGRATTTRQLASASPRRQHAGNHVHK